MDICTFNIQNPTFQVNANNIRARPPWRLLPLYWRCPTLTFTMAMSPLPPHGQGPGGKNKNLMCPVCREVYRSPRFLPCHHSFCLHCLEGLARVYGQHFPCPTCRSGVRVPRGGVQQFTRNFYLPDDELDRERSMDPRPLCSTHPAKELIYFCKKCDQSICSRCKNTKHEGHHGTVDLFEEAERCKSELAATSKRLERSINRLTKRSALAQDNLNASREKTLMLREQVRFCFENVQLFQCRFMQKKATTSVCLSFFNAGKMDKMVTKLQKKSLLGEQK